MKRRIKVVNIKGSISGSVISEKDCQREAPSTRAASKGSTRQGLQARQQNQNEEWRPLPDIDQDDRQERQIFAHTNCGGCR